MTKTNCYQAVYDDIYTQFDIKWTSVQYVDLVKPLYSALAARLKIDIYYKDFVPKPVQIPQSIDDQAVYWAVHYTTNSWGNETIAVGLFVSTGSVITTCKYHLSTFNIFILEDQSIAR